jgi:hypothetical protein
MSVHVLLVRPLVRVVDEGTFGRWRAPQAVSTVFAAVLRQNLLLTGPDEALARFLDAVLPTLRQPVSRWVPGQRFQFPAAGQGGTLIIENVGALPPDDQRRLFEWLTVTLGDTQIVSTTAGGLLPLVETGAFLEALYYRLNIICADVTVSSSDLDVEWALSVAFQEYP